MYTKDFLKDELIKVWSGMGYKTEDGECDICIKYFLEKIPNEISREELLKMLSDWIYKVQYVDDGKFDAPVPSKHRYYMLLLSFAGLIKDGWI